jgi:hypothetical protein
MPQQNTDKQPRSVAPIAQGGGVPSNEAERPAGTTVRKGDDKKPGGSGPSTAAQPAAATKAAPRESDAKRSEQGLPPTATADLAAEGRRAPMDDREQRIREIAYFLWEQEGYPDGRAEEHWAAAQAVVDAQDAERKNAGDDPRGEPLEK